MIGLVQAIFLGILRLVVVGVGGYVIAKGQTTEGIAMVMAASGFSLGDKFVVNKKMKDCAP